MNTALNNLSKLELITLLMSKEQALKSQGQLLDDQAQVLKDQAQVLKSKEENIQKQGQVIEQKQADIAYYQADIAYYQADIAYYKELVAKLQRMLFGQKRERFESESKQLSLPFEPEQEVLEEQQKQLTEKITYVRQKQSAYKGRLALPDHLPVEEVEIHPQGDLSQMVCIGKEITEKLECIPSRFFIRRYIRYKYAPKDKEKTGVMIGELPERVIDKGIPGPGLLASILVDKYMDHLPVYRQRQRFLRNKIPIASSTLEGWTKQSLDRLEPLYEHLVADTKSKGYLQVDETPIRVLERDKKGSTHQGYYWVYHSPIDKTVMFEYQPNRSGQWPQEILCDFKGYLQTDGYAGYEQIVKNKNKPKIEQEAQPKIIHLACWAHARRKFEEAKNNDPTKSDIALKLIQDLYKLEADARTSGLTPQERKELRLEKSLPIINTLGKWISQEVKNTLPKSSIGIALRYSMARWDALSAYLYDGILEIDNNLVENAIRPVALGRKNYLFAGSHAAAQRAAMLYSFFAMCKKNEVNPFEWLKYTLENIMTIKYQNIRDLYPQNFNLLSNT
jgi:transposase